MDEKELAARIQYFQGIAAKYGYQAVAASTVYRLFEEIGQPERLGFTTIRAGLYGKVINDDLTHLVKLQALKGASYSLWWGLSLPWIPHSWQTQLHWRRSFKAARLDLFETPYDYFPATMTDWREGESYIAHTLNGEVYLKETLRVMWAKLHQAVTRWFAGVESLKAVLGLADEQTQRRWAGALHYPNPVMIYAFTLGRLGHTEAARTALNRYFELRLETCEAQANLTNALSKISK